LLFWANITAPLQIPRLAKCATTAPPCQHITPGFQKPGVAHGVSSYGLNAVQLADDNAFVTISPCSLLHETELRLFLEVLWRGAKGLLCVIYGLLGFRLERSNLPALLDGLEKHAPQLLFQEAPGRNGTSQGNKPATFNCGRSLGRCPIAVCVRGGGRGRVHLYHAQ